MPSRRQIVIAPFLLALGVVRAQAQESVGKNKEWILAAEEMKRLALSWGDQAYGAVLVKADRIIGYGPSRVVRNQDPEAHAEREAIRHAISELGEREVVGAVLYSTSRPCLACERTAARAKLSRMFYGEDGRDAGQPGG